jgi:hypothetical protein
MEKIINMLKKYDCILEGTKIKHKSGKYFKFTWEQIDLRENSSSYPVEETLLQILEKEIKKAVGELKNG